MLAPNELRRLIHALSDTPTGLRDRALIVTMYRTGLRHSEALDLYPKDLDLDGGWIAVLSEKGDRRRTVGIDPGAIEVLRPWLGRRGELGFGPKHHLFCSLRADR